MRVKSAVELGPAIAVNPVVFRELALTGSLKFTVTMPVVKSTAISVIMGPVWSYV